MNHADVNHGLTRFGGLLIVFAVPPVATEPGEGPLDDPALGQNHKSLDIHRTKDGLQEPTESALHPSGQRVATVGPIAPNHFESREPLFKAHQHEASAVVV